MAKAKRRLTNIRTREVSLVDEAANNRRFIVVKRKGGPDMPGKKNADLLKDDDSKVLKLSAEVKETLTSRGNEAIEKIQAVLKKIEEVEVSKDAGDEVPGELIEEFEDVLKALPQFDNGDVEPDEDFGIEKAAEEIKKAGKKISSERLKKISEAASILSSLLKELGAGGSAASNQSHEGGQGMATNDQETKKRSPDVAFKLAEAEVLKAREALTEAEESADEEAIKKAKEEFDKADAEFKKAKEVNDEALKTAEIEKAKKEADDAAEKLRKAKGETDEPKGENAEVLKQIVAGQEKINEELKETRKENAELKKQLEGVSKVTQPSNGADTDDDPENKGDEEVDKAKDPKFWAGVI
jgi:DNA repair exonuclease SbcCD ATPase subunit